MNIPTIFLVNLLMLGDFGLGSGRNFLQQKDFFMIHEITREKLSELKELLIQLSNDQIAAPIEALHGSTVGMHMRHILEFYQCLFRIPAGWEFELRPAATGPENGDQYRTLPGPYSLASGRIGR